MGTEEGGTKGPVTPSCIYSRYPVHLVFSGLNSSGGYLKDVGKGASHVWGRVSLGKGGLLLLLGRDGFACTYATNCVKNPLQES